MANRYSDTLKWQDEWFVDLKATEKLLFLYLCDNCDIAGFLELSYRKIAFDLGVTESTLKGAFKGLEKSVILSLDERIVLVKNFIKHQKNLPINQNNKAHLGILKRIDLYANRFPEELEFTLENGFNFLGAIKPLGRGTGIGNNISNSKSKRDYTISIDIREENFKKSLFPFVKTPKNPKGLYPKEMVQNFFDHFREKNKSGTRMKFEMQDTWETNLRLAKWSRNNFGNNLFSKDTSAAGEVYTEQNNKIDHSNRI